MADIIAGLVGALPVVLLSIGFAVNPAMAWKIKLLVAANILLGVGAIVALSPNGNISLTGALMMTGSAIVIFLLVVRIVFEYCGLDRRARLQRR